MTENFERADNETFDVLNQTPATEVLFSSNAYGNDPELDKAKKIIEEGGDTNEITKLTPDLTTDLLIKLYKEAKNRSEGYPDLKLDGLKEIDEEVAKQLAKYEGYVSLNGLTEIDEKVSKELGDSKARSLSLNMENITPEIANNIGKYKGRLNLNGLKEINEEVAEQFANSEAQGLTLNISKLTPTVAEKLAKYTGTIKLSGLEEIDEKVTKELANSKAESLVLNMREIPGESAFELSKFKGYLSLDLEYMSEETAKSLLSYDGYMSLKLENIDPKAIQVLSERTSGNTSINGLKNMDSNLKEEFARVWSDRTRPNSLSAIDNDIYLQIKPYIK